MKDDMRSFITEFTLRRLAGSQCYRQGAEYFRESRVKSLREKGGSITATVMGTEKYRTQIRIDRAGTGLDFSCMCPVGLEGKFCKHLVATGLQWLDRKRREGAGQSGGKSAARLAVPEWLGRQKKSLLVDLLLEHANEDDDFWNRLEMRACLRGDGTLDVERLKTCLSTVVSSDDITEYQDSYDYFCRVENALDFIGNLLESGNAAGIVELCEHTLDQVDLAMHSLGDPEGYLDDIVSGFADLHHRACRKARPDRKELARSLFERELGSEHDIFSGASERYADVLQREGLAEYRRLAEKAWNGVKPLGPGDKAQTDSCRHRLRRIMEALARREGDVDFLVEIKKSDLTRPVCFLDIARLYKDAGRDGEALAWAERGIRAFEKSPDTRLLDFLADIYHRQGRHDKALDLVWKSFGLNPGLARYRSLRTHACMADSWPEWKAKAIALIRERIEPGRASRDRSAAHVRLYNRVDHSLLVQVLLDDNNPDSAWDEAVQGGCPDHLWMQLAIRREKTHPEDSVVVYQRQIENAIGRKSSDAYREAVRLLGRVRDLMAGLGREGEFASYLQRLGSEHARKRNFMKLLEKKEWI